MSDQLKTVSLGNIDSFFITSPSSFSGNPPSSSITNNNNIVLEEVDLSSKSTNTNSKTSNQSNTEKNSFANLSTLDSIKSESTQVMDKIRDNYEEFGYTPEVDENGLTHIKPRTKEGGYFKLSDYGGAEKGSAYDYEVVECIFDKNTGLDSLIVKDEKGNYRVSYGYTEGDNGDIMTDVVAGAKDRIIPMKNLPNAQNIQAQSVADYAYKMAKKDGTKLNFYGYSLGGCDAESGIKYICDTYDDAHDVIGSVTLLNPLHAPNLSEEDIKNITGCSNFKYYANEMDVVHTINSFEKFKEYQTTLPAVTEGDHAWTKNQATGEKRVSLKSATENEAHMIEGMYDDDYVSKYFDENGNLKEESPNVYDCDQLLKMYFGFNLEDFNSVLKNEVDYWLFDPNEDNNHESGLAPNAPPIVKDQAYLLTDGISPMISFFYECYTTDWTDPKSVNHFASQAGATAITTLTDTTVDAFAVAADYFGVPWLGDAAQEGNKILHRATYDFFDYNEKMINNDIETGQKIIKDISEKDYLGVAQDIGENIYNKIEVTLTSAKEIYDEYFNWIPFGH